MTKLYIGLMSGTSMDAIDAVLVDLDDAPKVLAALSTPLQDPLRRQLLTLATSKKIDIDTLGTVDVQVGRLFAEAALELLKTSNTRADDIIAIGSHGQTIHHSADKGIPFTLQIGDPNQIVERTGITTVADLRRRDIAAGGQGAPLVPAFHQHVFRSPLNDRVILNIGGIANITILPSRAGRVTGGFDTGPGNVLMDSWISKQLREHKDNGGEWAASGKVDDGLLTQMLKDRYFELEPPKTTGREYFNQGWLDKQLKRYRKRVIKKNVQTTLCELTASSIADAIRLHAPECKEVLVCGGGIHNLALMFRLQMLLDDIRVVSTEDYGIDPDYVEATAFAWLAKQTVEGKAGNLPSVTGAKRAVILGGIYKA